MVNRVLALLLFGVAAAVAASPLLPSARQLQVDSADDSIDSVQHDETTYSALQNANNVPMMHNIAPLYEEQSCGARLQQKYNCSEEACEDLVPGYINYLEFFYCTADNVGLQILTFLLYLLWMAFLLHLVETTTNNYFCASLTMAVDILKLSPNVAGVTFLAVGNAACDVIASIAAFATGVPKVGVGTTLGAGIFVTTAVIGVVSFVSDVRLARRSFVRDILFFIFTVVYLLVVSYDGYIDLGESVGFMLIYIIFVVIVGSARWIKMLRSPEEDAHGLSVAGSTGEEGPARKVSLEIIDAQYGADGSDAAGYNAEPVAKPQLGLIAGNRTRAASNDEGDDVEAGVHGDIQQDMLKALEAARAGAVQRQQERDMKKLKNAKYFAPEAEESSDEEDDDDEDGDLGVGSGDASTRIREPSEEDGGRSKSFVDELPLPSKPSRWTRQFLKTQHEAGPGYAPFQWTKYHKKELAKELANRLRARGASHVTTAEGRTIDFLELLAKNPTEAAELAASIGTAVTAAASKKSKPLTFSAAKAAASSAVNPLKVSATGGISSSSLAEQRGAKDKVSLPVTDVLAVLPHETIKPVAKMYHRLKAVVNFVQPYYHGFMHNVELPIQMLRKLTVPMLHEGAYRRRWICIVMPFMCAFFTIILTTHILKGTPTSAGGFPYWAIAFILGAALGATLHFVLPKSDAYGGDAGATQSLLSAAANPGQAESGSNPADHHHKAHHRPWYKKIGITIAGPSTHPLPQKPILYVLLVLSFLMALFWLLVIANEIVGTAIFIGKVLNIPDVVMGLTVLAVGNSINDLAASLTIARDGYASMAVAGAYAGPMFNILAGIGLPMLISTSRGSSYHIGEPTPLVLTSFAALLIPLTTTLVWVPLSGWRITHRIGRFLCAWFFLFIIIVLIVGLGGLSKGDVVTVG